MRVPSALLEHTELRKPLRDEVVVSDPSGACERLRDLCRPFHFDLEALVRLDTPVERHRYHGTVLRIAIVGCDEAHVPGHLAHLARRCAYAKGGDVHRAPRIRWRRPVEAGDAA